MDPNTPPSPASDVPLITASNFLVSSNVAEFHVSMAYTAFNRDLNAHVNRYSYSVTTSPQAALQLYQALGRALSDYEREFGPIPRQTAPLVGANGQPVDDADTVTIFDPTRRKPS